MIKEVIGFEPRSAWWKSRLLTTTPKWILYCTLIFHYIYFTIKRRKKNLAPTESLEIKYYDEALGCTFLSRFLNKGQKKVCILLACTMETHTKASNNHEMSEFHYEILILLTFTLKRLRICSHFGDSSLTKYISKMFWL